jgi:hypothetical protein
MARFRKRTSRRSFSRIARRSGSNKGMTPTGIIIGGAVYGAARGYVSNAIKPVTDMIPFGNLADNVVMGGISYLAAKKGKGMVKQIGQAGLAIEAALAGQDLINGGLLGGSQSSGSSNWN